MGFFRNSWEELNNKGLYALNRGWPPMAIQHFLKAIKRCPYENSTLYYNLAVAQVQQGQVDVGLSNMVKAANLGDQDAAQWLQAYKEAQANRGGDFMRGLMRGLGGIAAASLAAIVGIDLDV